MLRSIQFVLLLATMVMQSANSAALQDKTMHRVDRIVAVIHQQVITAGDWDEQERMESLVEGHPISGLSHRHETLERLVKRNLIVQQMSSLDFKRATALEIEDRLADIKKSYSSAGTEAGWNSILLDYGVDEPSLRIYLSEQLDMLRFIDAKFRAGVRIPQRDAQAYYNDVLLPQLKGKNFVVPPFPEVHEKIVAILTEKRVNELLEDWLKELQAEGVVQWKESPSVEK